MIRRALSTRGRVDQLGAAISVEVRGCRTEELLPARRVGGATLREEFSMANQERSSKEFDKTAGTIDDIQHDLQVMRDDMSRLAQQVASLLSVTGSQALREVKAQMSRAKQSLDGVLSDASEKGMEAVDAAREGTATALEALEDAVRQRPFATLAIAVGLGFLFGASWRR
jgi:ElaB/YqjD/DUF883 family membrane-anchored ribosome-binding protein